MSSKENKVIYVATSTLVIFAILCSPLAIAGLMCIFKTNQIFAGLLFGGAYLAILFVICSPEVILTETSITYRNWMSSRRVEFSNVVDVGVSALPAPTLVFHLADASEPFRFALKPFSKRDVTCILEWVREAVQQAHFDRTSADLARGDFTSITRETTSPRNLARIAVPIISAAVGLALAHKYGSTLSQALGELLHKFSQ